MSNEPPATADTGTRPAADTPPTVAVVLPGTATVVVLLSNGQIVEVAACALPSLLTTLTEEARA